MALAVIVAGSLAVLAWRLWGTGFLWDDFVNFRQAQLEPLSLEHLLSPTSGHFAPGHRLGDWVLQNLLSRSMVAAQVILLAGFAVTVVLFHRILVELSRPGSVPLVLTLLYATSIVHPFVLRWWASGLDRVPATIGTFVAILAWLRFVRTGRRWLVAVSVAALGLSLLFYVKPVFVPVYLVLMRVLLLEPRRPVRETAAAAAREWWVWASYAAVVVPFLVVYVGMYPLDQSERPNPGSVATYLVTVWFETVAPNLAGLLVNHGAWSPADLASVVVGQAVVVAALVWSVRRSRLALRGWAFFGLVALLNAVVVGATRITPLFGPGFTAHLLHFNLEIVIAFHLAAAATLPLLGVGSGARPGRRAGAVNAGPALVAAGCAAVVGLSWLGAYRLTGPDWWGARSRVWVDTVEAELDRARDGAGRDLPLVDGVTPNYLVPDVAPPYNSHSEILALLDGRARFDAGDGPLLEVRRDGSVRTVTFVARAGADLATLAASGVAVVGQGRAEQVDDGLCLDGGRDGAVLTLLPGSPLEGAGHVALSYRARGEMAVSLVVEPEPDSALGPGLSRFRVVNLPAGSRTTVFDLNAPAFDRFHLVTEPRSRLCVSNVVFGSLAPAG